MIWGPENFAPTAAYFGMSPVHAELIVLLPLAFLSSGGCKRLKNKSTLSVSPPDGRASARTCSQAGEAISNVVL